MVQFRCTPGGMAVPRAWGYPRVMVEQDRTYPYAARVLGGLVVAGCIGVGVVAACNAVATLATGDPLAWWKSASATQAVIAGAPFVVLALFGIAARRAWVSGLVLTALFWGLYLVTTVRADAGGDANIGLGILMLFSPVVVTVGSLIALRAGRRRDALRR